MKKLLAKWRGSEPLAEPGVAAMPIPPERLRSLRDDDQFIVSYPRSGNRWLRVMVRDAIVLRRPELAPPAELRALVPDLHHYEPDAPALAQFGIAARVLKSHNIRDIVGRRMIYLFRRAADALISFYHFRQKQPQWAEKTKLLSADAFCAAMLPGWIEHLELAIRQRESFSDRTLFVSYESLHAAPGATLRAALEFLGIAADESVVRAAVERNAFEKNRAQLASQSPGEPTPILRKGRVGSAADELLPETLARIESAAGAIYQRALALV